jgi:hypothetical protein
MSRRVSLSFDTTAQRWEIARADAAGTTMLEPLGDGTAVGRSPEGTIDEVVIDLDPQHGGTLPALALVQLTAVFGAEVARLVANTSTTRDIEMSVEVADTAPVLAASAALPGEPGRPVAVDDIWYEVTAAVPPLQLRREGPQLVVMTTATGADGGHWIRISDAETGTLLAIGRLRGSGDASQRADIEFGLARPIEHLHVVRTDEPIEPVGPSTTRRIRWAEELLDQAHSATRRRAATGRRAAEQAATIAAAIGDQQLASRAETVLRRAKRWQFMRPFAFAVGGVLVGGGLALALLRNDDPTSDLDSQTTLVTAPTASAVSTAPINQSSQPSAPTTAAAPTTEVETTTSTVPANLIERVHDYKLSNGLTLTITSMSPETLRPGDVVNLLVRPTVRAPHTFGIGVTEAQARQVCATLGITSTDVVGVGPGLDRRVSASWVPTVGSPIDSGQWRIVGQAVSATSVKEACESGPWETFPGSGGDGVQAAMDWFFSEGTLQLVVPTSAKPGTWMISLADDSGTATSDDPVVVEVAAPAAG